MSVNSNINNGNTVDILSADIYPDVAPGFLVPDDSGLAVTTSVGSAVATTASADSSTDTTRAPAAAGATPVLDSNSQKGLGADVASTLYGVNGQGLKIGIISDSYNNLNGAASDVTNGYLPNNVTVVRDLASGGADEGRAMMQLAYKIAPNAQYFFSSGYADPGSNISSIQACANAVAALQQAGCTIIIDDLGFGGAEGFFQTGTVLDNAINAAVAAGVNYFSAAGNDGKQYYQGGFTALTTTIANIGTNVVVNNFGTGGASSPYLNVTIANGSKISLTFEWAQPFASIGTGSAGAQNSLAVYLLDATGAVVASSVTNQVGQDPTQSLTFTNATASTSFNFVVVQNGGTVPAGQQMKFVFSNGGLTINNALANQGSGNIYGHELLTSTNVVGAVDYKSTPAFGGAPAPTDFTSVGTGSLLFNSTTGAALTTPINAGEPNFSAAQGSNTGVTGFAPFNGTSAAAPNAGAVGALVLQANGALTTTQLTSVLAQSAIPETSSLPDTGAGLIQARAAVEIATAYAGNRWTTAAGGNWGTAASWSLGTPTNATAVSVGDNVGAITGASYTVAVTSAGNVAGSIAVGTASGSSATLSIGTGGTLAVGGSNAANRTAGDLLVSNNGTLSLGSGSLSVASSLNLNNGTVTVQGGTITADNIAENAGSLTLQAGTARVSLTGAGLTETGGSVSLASTSSFNTTTLSVSRGSLSLAGGSLLIATQPASFTSFATVTDSGSFMDTGAVTIDSAGVTTAAGGRFSVGSLLVGATQSGFTGAVTVAGTLTDTGNLDVVAGGGTEALTIQSGGVLAVGGTMGANRINFGTGGGTLQLTSTTAATLFGGYGSTVGGFALGTGTLDLTGISYVTGYTTTYNATTGQLNLVDGSGNGLAALFLDTGSTYAGFTVAKDAGTGTQITVACFVAGTAIATPMGERPVEALAEGDLVRLADGGSARVRWLGHRRMLPQNSDDRPYRVRAHAFGRGRPARDLYLSPDHAIFAEGVLVPVRCLADGDAIAQISAEEVTYHHILLDRHEVILAEGLPCESLLELDGDLTFDNAPAAAGVFLAPCAPRVTQGVRLEAVRRSVGVKEEVLF